MGEQSGDPIGIIAGNGELPVEVAENLSRKGRQVSIFGFGTSFSSGVEKFEHEFLEWGQMGHLFKRLKQNNIEEIVMAGGIVGRPEISLARMDWGTMRAAPGLLTAVMGGDDTILSGVINVFEKRGVRVSGVGELVPEMLVRPGPNTSTKANSKDISRIDQGFEVARALGRFDIGQACVVIGTRAVAVEGVEGTDGMLQRVGELRVQGRLPNKRGGVLVKCVKPGQDERVDLPAIGPQTVQRAHEAGLKGIGVQAGKTIIVEMERTLELARGLGLFIQGMEPA